jgi:hypothetical protein
MNRCIRDRFVSDPTMQVKRAVLSNQYPQITQISQIFGSVNLRIGGRNITLGSALAFVYRHL